VIDREQAVRANEAVYGEPSALEIRCDQRNGVTVRAGLAGNLTEDEIVTRQVGHDQCRPTLAHLQVGLWEWQNNHLANYRLAHAAQRGPRLLQQVSRLFQRQRSRTEFQYAGDYEKQSGRCRHDGVNRAPDTNPFFVEFPFAAFVSNAGPPPDFAHSSVDMIDLIFQPGGAMRANDFAITRVEALP
jgi:hypothetical protein